MAIIAAGRGVAFIRGGVRIAGISGVEAPTVAGSQPDRPDAKNLGVY